MYFFIGTQNKNISYRLQINSKKINAIDTCTLSDRHALYEVQQILGHSDPKVTMRYAHLSTKALLEAANSAAVKISAPPMALVWLGVIYANCWAQNSFCVCDIREVLLIKSYPPMRRHYYRLPIGVTFSYLLIIYLWVSYISKKNRIEWSISIYINLPSS